MNRMASGVFYCVVYAEMSDFQRKSFFTFDYETKQEAFSKMLELKREWKLIRKNMSPEEVNWNRRIIYVGTPISKPAIFRYKICKKKLNIKKRKSRDRCLCCCCDHFSINVIGQPKYKKVKDFRYLKCIQSNETQNGFLNKIRYDWPSNFILLI